jgi:hypothetical protein
LIPNEALISDCFDKTKPDPVKVQTINIGLKDEAELMWFFDHTLVRVPKQVPRFISLDISFVHDCSGLAMSCIREWKEVQYQKEDGTFSKFNVPIIETDFVMRIKAKEGDRIPIHKIRKFVLDLRTLGFNIAEFTSDLPLAAEDTFQILTAAGIPTEYQSVDKDRKPYEDFISLMYEKRWVCSTNKMLFIEMSNLEKDPLTGKVDHPLKVVDVQFLKDGTTNEMVIEGSKDMSDAVVASVYRCLLKAVPQMPVEFMKGLIRGSNRGPVFSDPIPSLKMVDASGDEIIQVQTQTGMQKLADVMRKRRLGY